MLSAESDSSANTLQLTGVNKPERRWDASKNSGEVRPRTRMIGRAPLDGVGDFQLRPGTNDTLDAARMVNRSRIFNARRTRYGNRMRAALDLCQWYGATPSGTHREVLRTRQQSADAACSFHMRVKRSWPES